MRKMINAAARRAGYEVYRATPEIAGFFRSRNVDLVFDVGANVEQFSLELRANGYMGDIVSFKPVSSTFAELKAASAGDGAWEVQNYALGAEDGAATINVSDSSVFSSLLAQTPAAMEFSRAARVAREETIKVRRLDDLFEPFRGQKVFLKIDTQGFERAVLEGAQDALQHLLGVQAELLTIHLYEDVWSLPEALDYLMQRGFVLAQVRPTNFGVSDPIAVIELDCVFRRNDFPN